MAISLDGTTGISASGNITVAGTLTVGTFGPTSLSAAGNVTGGNIITAGLITATGNITGGNILTGGLISATGNITGAFILGNGSQLTGVDATQIVNGTSNAKVVSSGGNIAVGIGGTANVAVFATTGAFITGVNSVTGNITGGNIKTGGLISATGNITGAALTGTSLTVTTGNITGGNLLLSGAIIDSAQLDIQTSASNANIAFAPNGTGIVTVSTQVSAVGNVTGGNILTAGLISATGAITGASVVGGVMTGSSLSVTGAVTGASVVGGVMTGSSLSVTGTIDGTTLTGTSLTVSTGNVSCGNIINTNANGVGNIGTSTTRFNQVFALASSAQYADLAEKYTADADYVPGTVLEFGGDQEVTATSTSHSTRVAGIVSTQPSYIMNDGLVSAHTAMVSLTGRVPCLVLGPIAKGDRLVSSAVVGHAQRLDSSQYEPGCIIGKALEDYPSPNTGTIEVAVGRF